MSSTQLTSPVNLASDVRIDMLCLFRPSREGILARTRLEGARVAGFKQKDTGQRL